MNIFINAYDVIKKVAKETYLTVKKKYRILNRKYITPTVVQ